MKVKNYENSVPQGALVIEERKDNGPVLFALFVIAGIALIVIGGVIMIDKLQIEERATLALIENQAIAGSLRDYKTLTWIAVFAAIGGIALAGLALAWIVVVRAFVITLIQVRHWREVDFSPTKMKIGKIGDERFIKNTGNYGIIEVSEKPDRHE